MKKTIIVLLALCAYLSTVCAQEEGKYSYFAESNLVVGGGDYAPFWFVANRHGTVSSLPQDFSLRMAFFKDFKNQNEQPTFVSGYGWDYAFGLDLIGAFNGKINSLHQAYVKVKYGPFGVALGNFETVYGNQDVALSSGGFGWSGNSRPMPRFDIGITEFTAIPYTKGYVEIKGVFSNGFFADKDYVLDQNAVFGDYGRRPAQNPDSTPKQNPDGAFIWNPAYPAGTPLSYGYTYNTLLHHKNLYIRLGGKLPVNFTTGIEHYVIWAGKNSKGAKLPVNLKEYWQIVQGYMPAEKSNVELMDAANRYGEHSGQWNNRLDVKLNNYTVSAYWQYFIDDASFKKFENISDGLWGFLIRSNEKQAVTGILFEFLNTTNQSGPVHIWNDKVEIGGNDDYYNNSLFTSGWTYFGQTIGTPLISSQFYNKNGELQLPNNRVKAYHFGIDGYVTQNLIYRSLWTYSQNYGRHYFPFPEKRGNLSFLLESALKLKKWEGFELKAAVGGDFGKMYGDNFGVMLGIRKSGVF
ncbi:MAG: capsule assembly Wzi family protein [Prevotellaceae bacterium]|jgi:hypothetical protein|nr:capsule assembly Wzi family protein [Prevotellaceae bacterium]